MKKYYYLLMLITMIVNAETLFEVKDASNNKVLDVSTDGLRIFNLGDTLMVISTDGIRAYLQRDSLKGLSRSFSVSTTTSKGTGNDLMRLTGDSTRFWISDTGSGFGVASNSNLKGVNTNVLEVGTQSTVMREGTAGNQYTNFSPKNIFIGLNAGASTTIGNPYVYSGLYNLFIGNYAGQNNTSGYFNTFTGYMAGNASSTSSHNTFYGYQAGMNNDTGSYNTAMGFQAGYEMTGGYNNNVIGYRAGYLTSSGHDNVFIGTEAGKGNSSGNFNVALGFNTGYSLNDGESNIFMGNESGYSNTSGSNNLFLGFQSGYNTSVGNNNIFMGYQAGQANTTGSDNQFMGYMSGQKNTSGSNSMFLGWKAGQNNLNGYENLFVGYNSGSANESGFGNVMLGTYSGKNITTGNENVMIGRGAGAFATTSASNNVFIGSYAGYGNGANTGNVFIGYKVGYNNAGSNKLMIDNHDGASSTTSLIYGDFFTNALKINGTLNVTSATDIDNYLSLYAGTAVNEFSTDGTMAGNSDYAVPTESAVRSYVLANKDNLGNHTATQNIKLNGYYLSNDGGNEGVFVDTGGDVGIGTSVPGGHRLYVTSSATTTSGSTGYFVNSAPLGIALMAENSSTTSSDAAVLFTQKGSSGDILALDSWHGTGSWDREFRFTNTGNGMCDGSWTGGGADYAEYFIKTDPSKEYEPGDVIEVSAKGKTVESSTSEYSTKVVGVFSTNPVVIGNGSSDGAPENSVLVGMMGVVPTKVTNMNGEIKVGDFITSSSIQGVAMKADKPCLIIGRALESYNSKDVSKIDVLVNPGWAGNEAQIIEHNTRLNKIEEENEKLKKEIEEIKKVITNK